MIIAREKKATNIAEYLIYMFQIEDMLRASKFNFDIIEQNIISQFKVNSSEKKEIRNWYKGLIEMMKNENIEINGHLQFVINTLKELDEFHTILLYKKKDKQYIELYNIASGNITELKQRMHSEQISDIETCINGLYSLLLLRLQKKEVSKETLSSFSTFSNLMAYLAFQYKKMETGELEI